MSIAVVFPGQGSQHKGMGYKIYKKYDYVEELYKLGNKLAGVSLEEICFSSNMDSTYLVQLAVFITNCAYWEVFKKKEAIVPEFVLGHSLGEYNALYAAECLDFTHTFKLLLLRAKLMEIAASKYPGRLFAILGLSLDSIKEIISIINSENVGISNINCPGQTVLWVKRESEESLIRIAKDKGAKKIIPLNLAGCFHSHYMQETKEALKDAISKLKFNPPRYRLVMNFSGEEESDVERIKEALWMQVASPVQWEKSAKLLIKNKISRIIEVGESDVLSGIMLRIDKGWKVQSYWREILKEE